MSNKIFNGRQPGGSWDQRSISAAQNFTLWMHKAYRISDESNTDSWTGGGNWLAEHYPEHYAA